MLVTQEDGGNDGRLQGVVEGRHQVVHAVIVPESRKVSQHELYLSVTNEHEHEASDGKEPEQQTDQLAIESLQIGGSLVLLDRAIALAKVKSSGNKSVVIYQSAWDR